MEYNIYYFKLTELVDVDQIYFQQKREKGRKMNNHAQRFSRCGVTPFLFIYCDNQVITNILKRDRIQAIRDMSSHIDVMKETELSYAGKERLIPHDEFNLIMSEMKNIFTDLLKKISNPSSLRHIAKQAVHLFQNSLLISELPEHLRVEVCEICQDTLIEEEQLLKFINDELEHLSQLYNMAFSCKDGNLMYCEIKIWQYSLFTSLIATRVIVEEKLCHKDKILMDV